MSGLTSRKKILYLSYDGLTDPLGQSQILPYLQGLSDQYAIEITSFEKTEAMAAHGDEIRKVCHAFHLTWRPLKYHKSPPVLSTIYDLWLLHQLIKKLPVHNRPDIVHCRSYLPAIIGLWMKKKFGVKFIFDMRGFWADERVDGGLWNLNNPFFKLVYKYFKWKEEQFIKQADHVISLTENARFEIDSWRLRRGPISVIPTCVDMRLFNPEETELVSLRLRKELSLSDSHFVLTYVGSWGTWYMTQEILDFFSVLVSVDSNARLLIVTGDQPDLKAYEHVSKVIVRKASRREVPAYMGAANASICFIKPSFSKKASSATKIGESWAMNLPVVTNRGWGDIDRLESLGFPLLVCNSASHYENVARQLINPKSNFNRQMLLGQFDLTFGIEKYRSIYESLGII